MNRHASIVLAAFVAACGGSSTPVPSGSSASVAAPPTARIERIERGLMTGPPVRGEEVRFTLAERMKKYDIPAVSIAVFTNYELQWAKAYGVADVDTGQLATEDTTFLAGSISKSVNALGVMLAAADGVVALDQPINELLGEWKLPDNDLTRRTPVTLRKLLSHTAGTTVHGFPGYEAGAALPTIEQILDGEKPANTAAVRVDLAPGTKFRYSGGGITIAQLALTLRSNRPYPEVLRERVFAPLGMDHSSFDQVLTPDRLAQAAAGHAGDGKLIPGKRNQYPEMAAAGLWTTPSDLARFFAELARARAGKSSVVSRAIATAMTTKVVAADSGGVGLGVFLAERNGAAMFGHNGSDAGFQADALVSLDGGYGVIIMTNSDNGGRLFAEIERAVFAEYGWKGADPELVRVALTAEQRERAAGTYVLGGHPITIAPGVDKVELRAPFAAPVELIPVAPDRFVAREGGAEFRLDAAGKSIAFADPQAGSKVNAPRLGANERLPILELEAGRFDAAVALWDEIEKTEPFAPAVDEDHFNILAYSLMTREPESALLLWRMIHAAEPDSSNACDSLADGYKAVGNTAKAIEAYEQALRLLDADPRVPAGRKAAVRTYEQGELAKLRARK